MTKYFMYNGRLINLDEYGVSLQMTEMNDTYYLQMFSHQPWIPGGENLHHRRAWMKQASPLTQNDDAVYDTYRRYEAFLKVDKSEGLIFNWDAEIEITLELIKTT